MQSFAVGPRLILAVSVTTCVFAVWTGPNGPVVPTSALTNLTDAGMLPSRYAGRASALEIDGDVVTAVHLDCLEALVEIP